MRIRDAQECDAAALTGLMRAAKASWGYPDEWMQAWEASLKIEPEDLTTMRVCVAEDEDGILGFYGLVGSGQRVQLEHLWVRPSQMGKGVGRSLIGHALSEAVRLGGESVVIESDPHAEPFYLRMGAVRVAEVAAPVPGDPNRTLPILEIHVGRSARAVPLEPAG